MNSRRDHLPTFEPAEPPQFSSPTIQHVEENMFPILCIISHTFDGFQDILIKNYIYDDCFNIDQTINEYKKIGVLFAICQISKQKETFIQNHTEHWFTFGLVQQDGKTIVFITDSMDTEESYIQKQKFQEILTAKLNAYSKIDFVEYNYKEEYLVSDSNISIAIANLKILMDRFQNRKEKLSKEQFQKMEFCSALNMTNDFDRLIVNIGLSDSFGFRLKPALQKILSALQRLTERDSTYKLESEQLRKLINKLEMRNFSPRDQDKIDLRDVIIDLVVIFHERGQVFDEDTQNKLKKFFSDNRNRYVNEINANDELVRKKNKNSQVSSQLGLALDDRLTFLNNMRKLTPDLLVFNDLDAILKQFADLNKQQTLENRRIQLKSEQNRKVEYEKAIEINSELDDIRDELDYCARKIEAIQMMNINDLIILLGHTESSNQSKLSSETLEKLVEAGKTTRNIEVSLAILKIIKFMDVSKYQDIERILDEIIPTIPFHHYQLIKDLNTKSTFRNHPSLLKYFYRILTEYEDKRARDDTFKYLQQCQVDDAIYIIEVIRLEKKCLVDDPNIVDDCLEYVRKKNGLTLNCFEKLAKYLYHNEKLELIIEIIELDTQIFPKFFIDTCRDYIKSLDKTITKNIIRISKSLVKAKQMSLKDIPNIEEYIQYQNNFDDDILDLLYAEYENGHDIPRSILEQIKTFKNKNEYARNLIHLIGKSSENLDILRNSRHDLNKRKNALQNLIKDKQNHTLDLIKLLQSLIQYDIDLRSDAFRALIRILPKNFKIDLIEIGRFIEHDQTIPIEDITQLIDKDPQNNQLAVFLFLITDQIQIDNISNKQTSQQALTLLTRISDVKQNEKLIYDKLPYLLKIASCTTHDKVRENILEIIKKSINQSDQNQIQISKQESDGSKSESFLSEEIRQLEYCQIRNLNVDTLENLRKMIQKWYVITKEKVEFLIDALINTNVHSRISEILFEINLRQGLTSTNIHRLTKHTELLKLTMVVGILAVSLTRNTQLSQKTIDELWQQLLLIDEEKDERLKNYLIYATVKIASQKKTIPIGILKKMVIFLKQKTESMEIKILCAQVLSKQTRQISQEPTIIDSLKNLVLQIESEENFLLNKLIFESLKSFIEEISPNDLFLKTYYQKLCNLLNHPCPNEIKPLDEFILSNHYTNPDKFRLLSALNNTFYKCGMIDTSIFHQFDPKQWRKEILCSELLTGIFQMHSTNSIDEFELDKFRRYIHELNRFDSIEELIQSLIDKQNLHQFHLEFLNDVLIMLDESNERKAWNIVINDTHSQDLLIELRELWLEKRLIHFGIHFQMEELKEFNRYLPYRPTTINFVFSQLQTKTEINELIVFFKKLFGSGLTIENNESFLRKEMTKNISLQNLEFKLDIRLVHEILSKKFPYFHENQNYQFRKTNPYNKANTVYCYKEEDIIRISSKWMEEYNGTKLRISVSKALCGILNEYSEDHKSTIMPLNITDNHWITLALIYDEENDENIVLYKDSMGEHNSVEEREEIQKLLRKKLKNMSFKFHRSREQFDDYNSGVFTLGNMKIIAKNLSDKNLQIFRDFEKWNFTTQTEAIELRQQQFPSMYALNLFRSSKRRQFVNDHFSNQISNDELEEMLNQLCVEINSTNKQILRMNLSLNEKYQIIDTEPCEILKKLHRKLVKVLHSGWMLKSIEQMIKPIHSQNDIEYLYEALDPIYEYHLKEFDRNIKGETLIEILTSTLSKDLIQHVHDLAIFQTFQRSHDKTFEELTKEIIDLNRIQINSFIDEKKLTEEHMKVRMTYSNQTIQNWSTSDIKQWSEKIKKTSHRVNSHEAIAVVMRAIELTSQFPVRDIQLLSLLILINSEKGTGRLVQINTGEGKTTIVAMLAAIKALEGHSVDVVTSSPELAKPQSKQLKEFYEQFNLTVSHIGEDLVDIKTRYSANIVYGAANDFQGDLLRDEYSKLGTRNGRKYDVAIVDEVDSMLIDGRNHIVMLSSQMPAMDYLEPLLAAIWIQIGEVAKYIREINGKTYFIQKPGIINEKGEIRSDVVAQASEIKTSKEDFIRKCTEKHLKKLIQDVDRNIPKIKIPKHLRKLIIECQLPKWIDSAIHAKYQCHVEQHYLLRKGKITPVDASNTGVIQANMNWNNGLHQFLQIKHGLKITPESLTTNFISNVSYFRRYGSNLFGLTGTLGSEASQQLLKRIYHVDNVIIPPFRKKQYQELTAIIVNNENDWYENIIESSMNKLKNKRGVLIITKYIKEVDEIKNQLIKAGYDQTKIKTYRTEDESKIIKKKLRSGEIIIATNIAGRGTDIRAEKIDQYGGLHVLVTFLPPNERVEQQNMGRTSRTGNKGTGQFILFEKYENDYLNLKIIRDKQEESGIHRAEIEIEEVTIKDAVFEKFCQLLTEINDGESKEKKIEKQAVEERFAIWLKMQESTECLIKEEILKKFHIFKEEILADHKKKNLIQNPAFHVLIGNEYLKKNKRDAIKEYSQAIILDEDFQVNAYYNRGYARLAEYGKNCKRNKDEIDAAIDDFKRARKIIENNLEPMLHIIQQASTSEIISEQLRHKMILFAVQKHTIELAIGAAKEGVGKDKESKQRGCIDEAREKDGDIEVEHVEIKESLPRDQDTRLYHEEIEEFKVNGCIGSFKIKGLKPIDWNTVVIVATLGIAQIVAGAALTVYTAGAGSSIGTALIAEGVSDLITAVRSGIINRDFDWKSYGIQKAISLTVAIACAGFGAMLDVAKTVVAGVFSVGQVMTTTVKAGWIIVAKAIGTGLAKGVAKEIITQLIDYGVNNALMLVIREEVMKRVEKPIQNALLANDKVRKMLELDEKNRNNYYESLIGQKAMNLLHSNEQKSALKTITIGIAKGIATQKIAGLSAILKTVQVVCAFNELETFVPNFIQKLNEAIDIIYEEQKLDGKESQSHNQSEQQQYTTIKKESKTRMKEQYAQNYASNYIPEKSSKDIDLENVSEPEQIKLRRENKSFDELCRTLVTNVSVNICSIIQHKLISLVTEAGISYSVTTLTADLDRSLQHQIGNYQAERRIEFLQDGDRDNRIPDEFKHGKDDPIAVKKVDELIRDLKNGGEAGLPHLGLLSDETGRPIKVLNDKGQVIRIIGENKGGDPVEIQYHKPTVDNPQGHWTLPDGKEPAMGNSGQNNCLFNVIAQQTGKDPNQLRKDTAVRMENNKTNLANQAHDIQRLEKYKKDALTMGGVEKGVKLNPSELRYSQDSINSTTRDGTSIKQLSENIKKDGFKADSPIIVVRMADGELTSLDNRRVAATDAAQVPIIADIYEHDEELPQDQQKRFKARTGEDAVWKRMGSKDSEKNGYTPNEVKVRGENIRVDTFVKNTREFYEKESNNHS